MRSILTLTFVAAAFFTFSQSIEKGDPSYCHITLTAYHTDGSNEIIKEAYADVAPYHPGTSDTIVYELQDADSVTADFSIVSFFNTPQFNEELIYGTPVYDTAYTGYTVLGGGTPTYDKIWSFTDSAMFSFYFRIKDNPNRIHVVKLTRKPIVPLTVEEKVDLPVSVFPNPVSGDLYIQLPLDTSSEIKLVDASGRQLKAWKCDESQTLDMSSFQSGNYLLQMMIDGSVSTFRVQKVD